MNAILKNKQRKNEKSNRQGKHLSVVGNLQPKLKLKVYSSKQNKTLTSKQILNKLNTCINLCIKLTIWGFIISSISYYFAVNLDVKVNSYLQKVENQIKNREDLKSYLARVYSWSNLNNIAQANNLKESKSETIHSSNQQRHIVVDKNININR